MRKRADVANAASMVLRCDSIRPRRMNTYPATSSTVEMPFRMAFIVGRSLISITERLATRGGRGACRARVAPPGGSAENACTVRDHQDPEQRQVHDRAEEQPARVGHRAPPREAPAHREKYRAEDQRTNQIS